MPMRTLRLAVLALAIGACSPTPAPEAPKAEPAPAQPAYDAANPPAIVELHFDSAGSRLNGILYLANGPGPHPAVVLLHGYPGNERNLDLAQDLRREGFNVLFFHYRGAWGSGGQYSLANVVDDVAAATGFLRAHAQEYRTDPDRLLLVGHSMGGFAALQGAARDPKIKCAAGLAPADPGAIARAFDANPDAKAGFVAYSASLTMLNAPPGGVADEIMANRDAYDLEKLAPKLVGKSVLIVIGDKDTDIPDAKMLAAALKAEKGVKVSGVLLSGDHSFSWSRKELAETVIDWAKGCI
jgi:dipeptidyl aminopeptidase/acylaminoacyl peptidase